MSYIQPFAFSTEAKSSIENDPISENFYDKKRLAEKLAVSQSYVDKMMTQGLPRYKIGRAVRFRFSEVMEWLQRRRFP
jgi:excisionase family DNA binding protein